jgi:hypothetical protein
MNAPVHAAFARILGSICPPAAQQPQVEGEYLCTVNYDGLLLDVYGDGEVYYSGIAIMGSKVCIGGVMADERIDEIERMAEKQIRG